MRLWVEYCQAFCLDPYVGLSDADPIKVSGLSSVLSTVRLRKAWALLAERELANLLPSKKAYLFTHGAGHEAGAGTDYAAGFAAKLILHNAPSFPRPCQRPRDIDDVVPSGRRIVLDQATPRPILKSTPFTFRSSKLRLGRSSVHSGAKPIPRPADTSDTSEKVSKKV